jgi:hypothetical protein
MTKIPSQQLRQLADTVTVAIDRARMGQVVAGFTVLADGLEYAAAAAAAGEPWGAELADRYEHSLNRYTRIYGRKILG